MAYNRQPNVVLAGTALKQNPDSGTIAPPGIIPVTLDCEEATTTSLGVVQIGSGLSITPAGILSVTGGDSGCFVNVTLTSTNYTATLDDCYIGATNSSHDDDDDNKITITLPPGDNGKLYYIKNQGTGSVKVQGTGGQTIDGSSSKTLGTNGSFIIVFAGNRWNIL
jgi:hypothetical protein